MYLFGFITTAFTDHAASHSLASSTATISILLNGTVVGSYSFRDLTNGTVDCGQTYFPLPGNQNVSVTLQQGLDQIVSDSVDCLSDDDFIDEIDLWVRYFSVVAAGAFLFALLQVLFYQLAAERQLHHIRQKFYRAILLQDIGWFDTHSTGELSNSLSE